MSGTGALDQHSWAGIGHTAGESLHSSTEQDCEKRENRTQIGTEGTCFDVNLKHSMVNKRIQLLKTSAVTFTQKKIDLSAVADSAVVLTVLVISHQKN